MRMRRVVVIGLVVVAVLAWGLWRFSVVPARRIQSVAPIDTLGTGYRSVRLYFASPGGDHLISETRELPETTDLHERVAALVGELDRGPSGPGVAALPPGTSLLHVYLDHEGLMTIDLSRAFQQGFRGGSTAEYLAIASLVRTLAANLPEVHRILFVCGDEPIPSLGGHIALDRPIDVAEMP
jgi:spore germination protein GerM